MNSKIKVLQIAAVDVTIKYLLLPLIDRLVVEGYEVHAVCSYGKYVKELKSAGYNITPIEIARKISPISNLRSLWLLYRFIKKGKFDIVHTHTPVAGVLGRVAAKLAGVPIIVYTAHGFYFHEHMSWWKRRPIILVERIMGRFTDMILTVSEEDRATAIKEGISKGEKVTCIRSIGVNIERFSNIKGKESIKASLGITERDKVVGFIGRLVREKGIEELLLAMKEVLEVMPQAKLLIIGDTLDTDRDRQAKEVIKKIITESNLEKNIHFAGFREDIPELLSIIDLFVLPSHREGMPKSILEAMASGKPVVATNIRGCREEVVQGETGYLVPVKDPGRLAETIIKILSDEMLAKRLGEAGRRAVDLFDERKVLEKQLDVYQKLIQRKGLSGHEIHSPPS